MGKVAEDPIYLHRCGAGDKKRRCMICQKAVVNDGEVYATKSGECWHAADGTGCRTIFGREYLKYLICDGKTRLCWAAEPAPEP